MPLSRSFRMTRSAPPRVIVELASSSSDEYDHFIASNSFEHVRYNKPLILHGHGRLARDDESESADPFLSLQAGLHPSKRDRSQASRAQYDIAHQLGEFRNIVNDLEHCLRDNQTPEMAWRYKILSRTAKEVDQDILQSLEDDYRALFQQGDIAAQSTNALLQREWSQLHNMLGKIFMKRDADSGLRIDKGDNRRLRHASSASPTTEEDYFDRVSRQAELHQMQDKMHMVHDIYRDLAVLVDGQQEQVNNLGENALDAKVTAEAAADEVACYVSRATLLESPCGGLSNISLEDDDEQGQNDVLEFLSTYFDCDTVAGYCRPQQTHEVDVVYQEDADAIEIQHVEPPVQEPSPSSSLASFLDGVCVLQEDLVQAGRTVFEQECISPTSTVQR